MGKGLGRKWQLDLRDLNHLSRDHVPSAAPPRPYRYWYQNGWWGNQGNKPQCVAYGWLHCLEDSPLPQPGGGPLFNPEALYKEFQQNDEWPGEDYDGTSVRGGAKALQKRGLLSEYVWGLTVDDLKDWILHKGIVVMGTNWYGNMSDPVMVGDKPMLQPTGALDGGHCYVLNGYNDVNGLFRMKNSWGRGWGHSGNAWIEGQDLAALLAQDGEACMPTELKYVAQ